MTCPKNWQCFESAEQLAQATAKEILAKAEKAIGERGAFHFVLSGGKTPLMTYQILRHKVAHWENWHIYLGDERCLPANSPERNSTMVSHVWLNFAQIPPENIHFIPTELGAEKAKEYYKKVVDAVDWFDLTLLGMGEDGHTASLFPGHDYPNESVVIERNSPKQPPERVTLSYERLNKSRLILKQISGESKKQAVRQWLTEERLPIAKVKGDKTKVFISKEALPEEI